MAKTLTSCIPGRGRRKKTQKIRPSSIQVRDAWRHQLLSARDFHARHCARHFPFANLKNPHNDFLQWLLLNQSHLTDAETKAQHCWKTCLANKSHIWDLNSGSATHLAALGMCLAGFTAGCRPFYKGQSEIALCLNHGHAWGPYTPPHSQGLLMLFFWAGSKMTFMGIFPFEVRVFAHFTLKQGKKQELKQINNGSLGERPWRPRMYSFHFVIEESSYVKRSLSPFKWFSWLTPFPTSLPFNYEEAG